MLENALLFLVLAAFVVGRIVLPWVWRHEKTPWSAREYRQAGLKRAGWGVWKGTSCGHRITFARGLLTVKPNRSYPFGLAIKPFFPAWEREPMRVYDVMTFDPVFDDKWSVSGFSEPVVGLLDHTVRHKFRKYSDVAVSLSVLPDGIVAAKCRSGTPASWIADLVALSNMFLQRETIQQRLVANMLEDPNPDVRENNLDVLVRNFGVTTETRDAVNKATQDRDVRVRMRAASALGEEGIPLLAEIIETGDADIACEAVYQLADVGSESALIILREHLDDRKVSPAVIEVIGLARDMTSVSTLKKLFGRTSDAAIRKKILIALQQIGHKEALDLLIRAFLEGDVDLKRAAAKAMGTCGDASFLKALHELIAKVPRELRQHLDVARMDILKRIGPIEQGWLSVSKSAPETGALSLVNDELTGSLANPSDDDRC